MRLIVHIFIVFALLLSSCKTPPPPLEETFDDQVIVADDDDDAPDAGEPASDTGSVAPDVSVEPDEPPPTDEPQTFIPEPKLPEDMSFQETALARTVEQQRSSLLFAPILDGGCGIPTAIRAAADPRNAGYTVDSCSRAVSAAHAMTNQRVITKLGVLDISTVEIRHDGETIWSVADDCTAMRQQDNACKSDFITRRPTAMSFVGPVLSYHVATRMASAGGPPYADNEGYTIDVRTNRPAKFTALVDDDSLLNGLKRDSLLRRAVNPTKLDAAKTIDAIWKLWRTQDFADFGGYYFAAWDAENGLAEMRIWYLEDAAGLDTNELKELTVWVRPKPQWKSAFEDAATEQSGFMAR